MWRDITEKDKEGFNTIATHPLQSYEWGEFRKETGIQVVRKGLLKDNDLVQAFQVTIHKIPRTPWTIGYLPKGTLPTQELIEELSTVGKNYNCIFVQLEPNVRKDKGSMINDKNNNSSFIIHHSSLIPAAHPLFTKYTLQLDLTKSEEVLLQAMHPKARYNIKVAQKHGVAVGEDNSQKAFDVYLTLTKETTSRQKFFAHTQSYHQLQWQILPHTIKSNTLSSHLLAASYQGKILTTWILFVFKDILYYPYGASSSEHRETMHSTLMMWETIRWGKKHKLGTFDMWGSAEPNAPASDPWFGFTKFKERFGPEQVEFIGSYDLVINPILYQGYKLADKVRWAMLKLKR